MNPEPPPVAPGRTPLTDPRSLGVSAVLHVAILGLASLLVLGVNPPRGPDAPGELRADVRPVDNRAPEDDGGGAPGDLGRPAMAEGVRLSAEGTSSRGRGTRDDAAKSLLSDTMAAPADPSAAEALPLGPATTGPGLFPGDGGGGGGSGAGIGGGVGKGVGPGTAFFGSEDSASSFAFVIDCSGSMSNLHAIQIAKAELINSLDRLPPDSRFGVIFYNTQPTTFPDPLGNPALMAATQENKARVRQRLGTIPPGGGTDHARALRAGIALKPEVIFFLTDADRIDSSELKDIRAEAGSIRIRAIEFGDGPAGDGTTSLGALAAATGGSFRHIDLTALQAAVRPRP